MFSVAVQSQGSQGADWRRQNYIFAFCRWCCSIGFISPWHFHPEKEFVAECKVAGIRISITNSEVMVHLTQISSSGFGMSWNSEQGSVIIFGSNSRMMGNGAGKVVKCSISYNADILDHHEESGIWVGRQRPHWALVSVWKHEITDRNGWN